MYTSIILIIFILKLLMFHFTYFFRIFFSECIENKIEINLIVFFHLKKKKKNLINFFFFKNKVFINLNSYIYMRNFISLIYQIKNSTKTEFKDFFPNVGNFDSLSGINGSRLTFSFGNLYICNSYFVNLKTQKMVAVFLFM